MLCYYKQRSSRNQSIKQKKKYFIPVAFLDKINNTYLQCAINSTISFADISESVQFV